MSDRKTMKQVFDQQFNAEMLQEQILSRYEKNKRNQKRTVGFSLAFITIFMLMISTQFKQNFKENEDLININQVKEPSAMRLDLDVKIVDAHSLPYHEIFDSINLTHYYLSSNMELYGRSDIESSVYDQLVQYEKIYHNTQNDNWIKIAYSEEHPPVRDYYFKNKHAVSKIKDVEMIIYQYENSYMVQFQYKNLYFDIETYGLTQPELIALLKSMIQ